ncbi:hypothetical protein J6590_082297 [Homalodisca vitripennis]|nr:hypothetical protein J6590_082297 [Homalodisca vitripennis]
MLLTHSYCWSRVAVNDLVQFRNDGHLAGSVITMCHRWSGVLRVFHLVRLIPFRVSDTGHAICTGRGTVVALGLWSLAYCFGIYLFIWLPVTGGMFGYFDSNLRNTFKVYNIKFVLTVYSVLGLSNNIFCLTRLHLRDLGSYVTECTGLHARLVGDTYSRVENKRFPLLYYSTLTCVYILPFFTSFLLTIYVYIFGAASPPLWLMLSIYWFSNILNLPGPVMTTVFYILLETLNEAFVVLCKRIDSLAVSINPKPFLEVSLLKEKPSFPKSRFSVELVHSVRKCHDEVVQMMENVMNKFQADILGFFLVAFYHNVMYVYSIVYTGMEMTESMDNLAFLLQNVQCSVSLMVCLWFVCAGPSKIQAQQRELLSSIARLAASTCSPTSTIYEIRILQLQSRNHVAYFSVFGMFKLNNSLLFTMCASILSYIVILIQFAIEPPVSDVTAATSAEPYLNGTATTILKLN